MVRHESRFYIYKDHHFLNSSDSTVKLIREYAIEKKEEEGKKGKRLVVSGPFE